MNRKIRNSRVCHVRRQQVAETPDREEEECRSDDEVEPCSFVCGSRGGGNSPVTRQRVARAPRVRWDLGVALLLTQFDLRRHLTSSGLGGYLAILGRRL